jgi:CPA2 family monovalent cation:H+ antiporter-2
VGGGRVGSYVAQLLQRLNLACVVIEIDQRRVEDCQAKGLPVIYGDASQPVVLEAVAIEHARLLLITTPSLAATHAIAQHAHSVHAALHIVARAESVEAMEALHKLGVYEIVQPEFEAGLEIIRYRCSAP